MKIARATHIIDAKGIALGRVASAAAKLLRGKHKTCFERNQDNGDTVRITNLAGLKFTGNKMEAKLYYQPTERPGFLKSESLKNLWNRRPKEVLRKAVWGMLPKNSLRKSLIKRLIIE